MVIAQQDGVLGMAYRVLDVEGGGIIVTGIMMNSAVQDSPLALLYQTRERRARKSTARVSTRTDR